jgi:hypothetical protein
MKSKKTVQQVCNEVGLKYGEYQFGGQVFLSLHEPGGIWFRDNATVLALEPFADDLPKEQGDKIKVLANHVREGQRLKKEREAREAEAKKAAEAARQKREAELRQKQETDLRNTIRQANPGISDKEVEEILPEMRKEQLKQRTKTALINMQRGDRKF